MGRECCPVGGIMGKVHAYQFEAKGVQRYLFASGRLRDLVGASDLVAGIAGSAEPSGEAGPDDLIGDVLAMLALTVVVRVTPDAPANEVSFSRRAGAVFCLHGREEALVRVRRAIRERVMTALPGLEIADALGVGADEIASRANAQANGSGIRANMMASVLPLGRPVIAIAPQTGLPAVATTGHGFVVDIVTQPQREWGQALQKRMEDVQGDRPNRFVIDGVARRFHHGKQSADPATGAPLPLAYPRRFEKDDGEGASAEIGNPLFPFTGADKRVGYVHADLSGLGEGFRGLEPENAKMVLDAGRDIEQAILAAARAANEEIILPACRPDDYGRAIAPARPIVIGGDDMTFIVRADLALRFAVRLLELIEEKTKGLLGGLSACGGVAIVNKGMPFPTASALAESLCKHAKKRAKADGKQGGIPWPSLLSFHVQTQTAEEDYGRDILPTLVTPDGRWLAANPYAANERSAAATGTAQYSSLDALAGEIAALGGAGGVLRQIRGELANGRLGVARALWRRMVTRPDLGDRHERFKAALKTIIGDDPGTIDVPDHGALFDALALIDLKAISERAPAAELQEELA